MYLKHTTYQPGVVIAASGPGGATVALEMSRKGKKVILCEAGKYHKWFGYTASTMNILEAKGMTFSKEGNRILSAKTAGGGSVIYGGLAFSLLHGSRRNAESTSKKR